MEQAEVEQHLRNAEQALQAVRHAKEDFDAAATIDRKNTAVRNFVEQGRSVTWALEHIKKAVPDWEEWWAATIHTLRTDPVTKFFYEARNPIVKQGRPVHLKSTTELGHFEARVADGPPGTKGIAFDHRGPVWILEDGTELPIPTELGNLRQWEWLDGITDDLGRFPLPLLMQRHLAALEHVVVAARVRVTQLSS